MKYFLCLLLFLLPFLIPKSTFAQVSGVTNIAISPDGQLLAKAVYGKDLTVWNIDGEKLRLKKTLPFRCNCTGIPLAISSDNKTIAVSYDKIQLLDIDSGKLKHTLNGYGASPGLFTFSPNGQLLVGGMRSGEIMVWNTRTGKLQYAMNTWKDKKRDYGNIKDIAFAGNKTLISGFGGGKIYTWNIVTGQRSRSLNIGNTFWIVLDKKGRTAASRGSNINSPVHIWDVQTGKLLHSISLYGGNTKGAISSDGSKLITWSFEWKTIKEWDTRTGKLLHRWNLKPSPFFEILQFLPNGKQFVSSAGTDKLKIWNIKIRIGSTKVLLPPVWKSISSTPYSSGIIFPLLHSK
jgi:WD40 repeat protein